MLMLQSINVTYMYNTDDYKVSGELFWKRKLCVDFGLIAAILFSGEFAAQLMLLHDLY